MKSTDNNPTSIIKHSGRLSECESENQGKKMIEHNMDMSHVKNHSQYIQSMSLPESWSNVLDPNNRRSSVVHENEKYIVFKDKSEQGPDIFRICEESLGDSNRAYAIFMRHHTSYDLIPISSKLVVFDTELVVRRAFFGLVYNGVRAAPLWDSKCQRFIGMLTITDFIRILCHYYKSAQIHLDEFESEKISQWRETVHDNYRPLIFITPEETLLVAVQRLLQNKVHRLPVVDLWTGNVLHILTHKRILKYLTLYMDQLPVPDFMHQTLGELGIGTYEDVAMIHEDTKLIDALNMFVVKRVSALPVLNSDNLLVDIYSKFDAINLAATQTYNNLDVTVNVALQYRKNRFHGVATCKKTDIFNDVVKQIADAGVHRLVIVEADNHVVGILSLSDILKYLVVDAGACKVVT